MADERNDALEDAALCAEEMRLEEVQGLLARRKRAREDAQLRHDTIKRTKAAIAADIRSLKAHRRRDPMTLLREIADLGPDDRHDHFLTDAWPLAWKGWVNILVTTQLNGNSIPPYSTYRIELTEAGRSALSDLTPSP